MADPLILSGLMTKRAELDGDLRQAEKRIAELRADRDIIDAAIRIFDPSRLPHKVKPHLRRPKPRMFRHGECSRAILGMLRDAEGPLTIRQVVDRLAVEYHLDIGQPSDRDALVNKVRNTLLRHSGKTLVREQHGADVLWRAASIQ